MSFQDPSNNKEILHSESNVFNHDNFPDQEYTESPKISTSTYENEIDTVSFNKILTSPKEYKTRNEPSDMYQQFSTENNFSLTCTKHKNRLKNETVTLDIQDTATGKTMAISLHTENNVQFATYEEPVSQSNAKSCRDVKPNTNSVQACNGDTENLTSTVNHILQEKEEKHPATIHCLKVTLSISIEMTNCDREGKEVRTYTYLQHVVVTQFFTNFVKYTYP